MFAVCHCRGVELQLYGHQALGRHELPPGHRQPQGVLPRGTKYRYKSGLRGRGHRPKIVRARSAPAVTVTVAVAQTGPRTSCSPHQHPNPSPDQISTNRSPVILTTPNPGYCCGCDYCGSCTGPRTSCSSQRWTRRSWPRQRPTPRTTSLRLGTLRHTHSDTPSLRYQSEGLGLGKAH